MTEKWTHLISIPSSTSRGTTYGVDVNADGTLMRCRCAAFIHSKETPKWCKHLEDERTGRALREYIRKNGLLLMRRKIGRLAEKPVPWNRRVSYYDVPCTEPTSVVNSRELEQAETIINEAQRLVQSNRDFAFPKLQEALEALGRP